MMHTHCQLCTCPNCMAILEVEAYDLDRARAYQLKYSPEECSAHVDKVMSKILWGFCGILLLACGMQALLT